MNLHSGDKVFDMLRLGPILDTQIPMGNPQPSFIFRGDNIYNPFNFGGLKNLHFSMGFGVLTSTPPFGPSPKDHALPVFFAGDALREPFWPMGEGCSRGFMGAFDTVWTVRCGVPRDGEQLPKAVRWSSETSWLLLVKRVVWFESGPLFIGVFPWFF